MKTIRSFVLTVASIVPFAATVGAQPAGSDASSIRPSPFRRIDILVDARCEPDEWSGATSTPIGRAAGRALELLSLQDRDNLYLCVPLPEGSYGTADLYVLPALAESPTNLHASAQVGERARTADGWPEWTFGNNRDWYSPPVAATGATVQDGRARLAFQQVPSREFRIRKSKFGPGPWRVMLELRALGPERSESVVFPANASKDDARTWSSLEIGVPPPPPYGAADALMVPSETLGAPRAAWIHVPSGCSEEKRCGVLYVLDAHALFPLAVAEFAALNALRRTEPRIVVGIPSLSAADRAANFIPHPGFEPQERERTAQGIFAPRFLAFLEKDLIPFVIRHYPASEERALAGHSLAGLFTLWAFSQDASFTDYIAMSPSLGWARMRALDDVKKRFQTPSAREKRVFASVANEPDSYLDSFARLETLARETKPRKVKTKFRKNLDEDHSTTVPPSLDAALRWLYVKIPE